VRLNSGTTMLTRERPRWRCLVLNASRMRNLGKSFRRSATIVSRLLGEVFGASNVSVMAAEELHRRGDDYELVIAVRATKSV
jgi:hypothetical protein